MNRATFVLSAGRCGTQWLAKALDAHYGNHLVAVHEPLFLDYLPRLWLGAESPRTLPNAQIVLGHAEQIDKQLETGPYIECGWPCYGALEYFRGRFAGRMRIVHLTRDPVLSASSMMTHRHYASRPDNLTEKALLTPEDPGARLSAYRDRWADLSRYEMCLYFWAEIQALGLALESEKALPWLRISSEALFTGDALAELTDFLDLQPSDGMAGALNQTYDKYRYRAVEHWNPDAIADHPQIIALARQLGYDPLSSDRGKPKRDYQAPFSPNTLADPADPSTWGALKRTAPCPCGSGKRYKHCHGHLG